MHNLSGQSKRLHIGCPYCLDGMDSMYLSKSRKIVYMGHRRFLPCKHPFRKMKAQFDGEEDNRAPSEHKPGKVVYA